MSACFARVRYFVASAFFPAAKELYFRDAQKLGWQATLSSRMIPEARGIAKKILKDHEVRRFDKDILRDGDALIRAYEKEHAS